MADYKIGNWYKFEKDGHNANGNIYVLASVKGGVYAVNVQSGYRFGEGVVTNKPKTKRISGSQFDECVDGKAAYFTLVRDVDKD